MKESCRTRILGTGKRKASCSAMRAMSGKVFLAALSCAYQTTLEVKWNSMMGPVVVVRGQGVTVRCSKGEAARADRTVIPVL